MARQNLNQPNFYVNSTEVYGMLLIMNKREFILSLIKDDLINYKLVRTLNDLGLNADAYHLHLSETIFELMGLNRLKDSEVLYKRYREMLDKVKGIDLVKDSEELERLTLVVYRSIEDSF